MRKMMTLLFVAVLVFVMASFASATQLITNGGFDTGNFSGWTVGTNQTQPSYDPNGLASGASSVVYYNNNVAWSIRNTPIYYFGSGAAATSPIMGNTAFNNYDGSGGIFFLQQQFNIKGGLSAATLAFDWGTQTYYSGANRSFSVNLLSSQNSLVSNLFTYTSPTGYDPTWDVTHTSLDLNSLFASLATGTYTLQFLENIPQSFTGPANFGIDNISLDVTAATAPVPEPGTMVLLGFGLLGIGIYSKRRKN